MAQSVLELILRSKKTGTGAAETKKELDETGASLSKAGQIAGGLFKAGLAAAAGAAVSAFNDTVKYNSEIRTLAMNLNSTTEETSRLVQVADDLGVSQEALTSALQLATKNGFAPTIENIAALSDKMRAIDDPTQRAAELSKVFGRNWAALVPLLNAGGDAIRQNAANISDSLIVTETAAQQTREFQIAQDDLGDSVSAMAYEFSNVAMPVVTDFFKLLKTGVETLDLLVNWQKKITEVQTKHEQAVRNSARSYDEYLVEIVRANGAEQERELVLRDLERGLISQSEANDLVAQSAGALTQSQFDAAGADAFLAAQVSAAAAMVKEEATNFDVAKAAADLHAQAIEQNAKIAADNQAAIANYADTVGTLAQKLKDATTAEATQALAQSGIDALQGARDKGTLTNEEYDASLRNLLLTYGLATEKSIAMGEGQTTLNQLLSDGVISADTYVKSIGNVPKAAADGKIALDELVKGGISPAQLALTNSATATNTLKTALDKLPRNIKIQIQLEQTGSLPDVTGRAGGGPVSTGVPVNVNEVFREQFVPYAAGTMMPGTTNNVGPMIFNIQQQPGQSARALAAEIKSILGHDARLAALSGSGWIGS